jgi:hydrogenase maturation protease
MTSRDPLLVLGIGNLLLGDDGLGPAVVERLWDVAGDVADGVAGAAGLPPDTDLVDGGTLGLALLPLLAGVRALVVVDAVDVGGAPPGTLHVLTGERIGDAYQARLTAHQVGAGDLIAVARLNGTLPPLVALVGVQPQHLRTGVGLSDPVRAALAEVSEAVRRTCWRLHRLAAEPATAGRPRGA